MHYIGQVTFNSLIRANTILWWRGCTNDIGIWIYWWSTCVHWSNMNKTEKYTGIFKHHQIGLLCNWVKSLQKPQPCLPGCILARQFCNIVKRCHLCWWSSWRSHMPLCHASQHMQQERFPLNLWSNHKIACCLDDFNGSCHICQSIYHCHDICNPWYYK